MFLQIELKYCAFKLVKAYRDEKDPSKHPSAIVRKKNNFYHVVQFQTDFMMRNWLIELQNCVLCVGRV